MKLVCIKINELKAFLESEEFKKIPVIPISKRRGLAQADNPRARAEDVALILAYLDNEMLAYLGFLPDDIFNGSRQLHLAWMSCIWVSPKARGKGVAKALLKKGFEVWDHKLLATEFTAPAKRLYDKLDLFDDLLINRGLRCYLRFNLAKLLPTSRPKLKPLTPLLKAGDFILNIFNKPRLLFYSKKPEASFKIEVSKNMDQEIIDFIKNKTDFTFLKRGSEEIFWLLENPWLGKNTTDEADAKRYHFSVYSRHFEFNILKIKKDNSLKGVLLLAIRDDALKFPYSWVETGYEKTAIQFIEQYMIDQGLNMLTVYQQALIPFFRKTKTSFFLKRPFNRHYLISKGVDKKYIPEQVVIQDGDGDCAFT